VALPIVSTSGTEEMKYGEKDDTWRTKGRLKSFEVDRIGRVTVEVEKYYLAEPKYESFLRGELPGWISQLKLTPLGASIAAGEGYGKVVLRLGTVIPKPPSAPGDDRSPEEKEKEVSVDVTLERTPLTMHPRINEFLRTYGGTFDGNEIHWVEKDPTKRSARLGYNKDGDPVEGINPFYGLQDYLEVGVIAGVSQQHSNPIGKTGYINQQVGKCGLIDYPDPLIPPAPKGRNWLRTKADVEWHGSGSVTSSAWQLSGIGGWEPLIYSPQGIGRTGGE
jgi:hypothetical protein